ncbi:DUF362 domain-containing protein [candidate division KSB3 bacterium]|jgi:uncharacterized protein (DUF362 family)|uniref:DUF362 domain-containing protein n=1 Tax=candidate division KSB3 bacterium TaxID=2044937 RepID=A0A9D5JUK8_9BACT|nr:DUF362 domain-containing protein [candidate division KSB3 bacterium]MBD3324423.1 DUF362 domain-containing protein [candidate division KSB3 bacterium]
MPTHLSRREFIGTTLKTGAALGLLASVPGFVQAAETEIDIAVAQGDPAQAVHAVVQALGGMARFVNSGQVVVLKPNMSWPSPPEWGSNTHPAVVTTVAQLCLDAGAKRVMVLDYPLRRPEVVMRRAGIAQACEGMSDVHVFTLAEQKFYQTVDVPQGKELHEVEIAKDVLQADVLINLPVAKSHMDTGVSFGMKNLMGLIWDREYFHQYIDLNQGIADLSTVIRPDLIIMDATRPMTTAGPGGPGKIVNLDTVIAGTDPVAVDSYTVSIAQWYGHEFSGKNVKYIQAAADLGLGDLDINQLRVRML